MAFKKPSAGSFLKRNGNQRVEELPTKRGFAIKVIAATMSWVIMYLLLGRFL